MPPLVARPGYDPPGCGSLRSPPEKPLSRSTTSFYDTSSIPTIPVEVVPLGPKRSRLSLTAFGPADTVAAMIDRHSIDDWIRRWQSLTAIQTKDLQEMIGELPLIIGTFNREPAKKRTPPQVDRTPDDGQVP